MTAPDSPPFLQMQTPFAQVDLAQLMRGMGHSGWLDMRVHARGADWIELAMPWNEAIMGSAADATCAAGPIIGLLDNAAGIAAWQRRGLIAPQVTVDLRIDHLRSATPGRTIIARGECHAIAGALAYVRGFAHDGAPDDPVAHLAGSFMLLDGAAA